MPREIYNEGRVQGMSAYEVYVREHLSEDIETQPASEREWLAASLASGSSLIYKVPTQPTGRGDDFIYTLSFKLPEGTKLGAANTITASFFDGDIDDSCLKDRWATKVTSYGDLIVNNTNLKNTYDSVSDIDKWNNSDSSLNVRREFNTKLLNYMKIIDGVVLQPGKWFKTDDGLPNMDLEPDMSSDGRPLIRLKIRGDITESFFIIFTGFTIKSVLSGTCGLDGSTNTVSPQDGDFLGPAVYPWANKITFITPTSYMFTVLTDRYRRKIVSRGKKSDVEDADYIENTSSSIIDLNSLDIDSYYKTNSVLISSGEKYTQPVRINSIPESMSSASVLTVYQRSNKYPPALWASKLNSLDSEQKLNPIDIVAPGSVKVFNYDLSSQLDDAKTTMKDYEATFPGTHALNIDSTGTMSVINSDGNINSSVSMTIEDIPNFLSTSTLHAPTMIKFKSNQHEYTAIALTDKEGNQYPVHTSTTKITALHSDISWDQLLYALANKGYIDLLGDKLKDIKQTLVKSNSSGDSCPYIAFGTGSNARRLYICSEAPTDSDIPEGSIGIGWGIK